MKRWPILLLMPFLWANPMEGSGRPTDADILNRLNSVLKGKIVDSVNDTEIKIEKYFINYASQSPVAASDLIIVATVEKIKDCNAFAGYGTEVIVSIQKVIKGQYNKNEAKVNLISGKKIRIHPSKADRIESPNPDYGRIRLGSEPDFKVGEQVLLGLSSTPLRLHSLYELYEEPHPLDKEHLKNEWYQKKLQDGFEPRFKRTVKDGKVFWRGEGKSLDEALREIRSESNTQ